MTGTNLDRIEEILSDAENLSNKKSKDEAPKDKGDMVPVNDNYSRIDEMREEAKFLNHEKSLNANEL